MRRVRKHSLLALLLATAALAPACTSPGTPGPDDYDPSRTTVRVVNRNFYEMTIYVLRGTSRTRLGSVPGLSTQSFVLPPEFVSTASPVRFQADPVGASRAPISQELMVRPGDEVGLTIPP